MRLQLTLIVVLGLLFLSGCGGGDAEIVLPAQRPTGSVQGNVLGGLYSGGTISAYALSDGKSRQFLAKTDVQPDGKYNLQFASQTTPVMLEVSGGSYLNPSDLKQIESEPDFILSSVFEFQSAESHVVNVTPFTHLATGLLLYSIESGAASFGAIDINATEQQINRLFSINLTTKSLGISYRQEQKTFAIAGDEKQALLIMALAQIANAESIKKELALQELYNLSSLTALMYEDIRQDGKLDGKSRIFESGGIKPLAFGDQKIDNNFYRLNLALAAKKVLGYAVFSQFADATAQQKFILAIATSDNALLGEPGTQSLSTIMPKIKLASPLSPVKKGEFTLDFTVENAVQLQIVEVKLNEFALVTIDEPLQNSFSISVNTRDFDEGSHDLSIVVKDSFDNSADLLVPVTFDNSAPAINIDSAALTNKQQYVIKGSFSDDHSPVQQITINGKVAVLLDNRQWTSEVTLNPGLNDFTIVIQDQLGNSHEMTTQVTLDDTVPVISVNSMPVAGQPQFVLSGEYTDTLSSVASIKVNDQPVTFENNLWSYSLTLKSGDNPFVVSIADQAGNTTELTSSVVLDESIPMIAISSSPVTNLSQFTLTGNYQDAITAIKAITVNGEIARLLPDQKWEQNVNLERGSNAFILAITDEAGNTQQVETHVLFDDTIPAVTLTSDLLTNQVQYELHGEYSDTLSNKVNITVNGISTQLLADQQWSHAVNLQNGKNEFVIRIEDEAGNAGEIVQSIGLDTLPPTIELSNTGEVRFSSNDGSFVNRLMQLDNDMPFYIESSKLSLSGMLVTKNNLLNAKIPFYSFSVTDQLLGGLESAASELVLEYRYLIGDAEVIAWKSVSPEQDSGELLIPLVSEYLSNAWFKVNPQETHTLEVRAADKLNNTATIQASFKAQFYVPDVSVAVNDKLTSLANGSFTTRKDYINKDVIAVNYNLVNTSGWPYQIRLEDLSQNSVIQDYEDVLRSNKVQKQSVESWQRSTLSSLGTACPKRNNDWKGVTELWNRKAGSWVKTTPAITNLEIEDVFTDTPTPPAATAWADFSAPDQEFYSYSSTLDGETISYNFDYIFNFDTTSLHEAYSQPGYVKNWTIARGSTTTPCADVVALQSKLEFKYLPVTGYPRNTVTPQSINKQFGTSRFVVLDEDQKEIVAKNGWYDIPAGRNVTIRKYVATPDLIIYSDGVAANPSTISDYKLHQLDKKFSWTISQNLRIETQFDPANLLIDDQSVKSQNFARENKSVIFNR